VADDADSCELASIGEERLATLSLRYYKVIVGCVMQMPVRDGEGRPRYDAGGQQVFSERVLRPKRRELERELVRLYPHDYNRKTDPWANRTVAEEQFPDDGLELTENIQGDIGTLDEHGVQHNYADSLGKSPTQPESGSNRGRAMGRPHKLTPELSARILGYYKESGNLRNAAVRAGISKSTLFSWIKQGKDSKSGRYRDFCGAFTLARAQRGHLLATRHHQVALGGVVQLPRLDRFGRQRLDSGGKPLSAPVYLRPNLAAMEWELQCMDPEKYGRHPQQVSKPGNGSPSRPPSRHRPDYR